VTLAQTHPSGVVAPHTKAISQHPPTGQHGSEPLPAAASADRSHGNRLSADSVNRGQQRWRLWEIASCM
jgi:hypothetical protein